MSDTFGTSRTPATGPTSADAVHEAYSFACMNCGHGWEQAYEITHHVDEHGHTHVIYRADGQPVPSPLTRPSCANCGGHLVRIMRSGRVASARRGGLARLATPPRTTATTSSSVLPAAGSLFASATDDRYGVYDAGDANERAGEDEHPAADPPHHHHWLADLRAFFHRKPQPGDAPHDRAA